jgi:hypothetical protein
MKLLLSASWVVLLLLCVASANTETGGQSGGAQFADTNSTDGGALGGEAAAEQAGAGAAPVAEQVGAGASGLDAMSAADNVLLKVRESMVKVGQISKAEDERLTTTLATAKARYDAELHKVKKLMGMDAKINGVPLSSLNPQDYGLGKSPVSSQAQLLYSMRHNACLRFTKVANEIVGQIDKTKSRRLGEAVAGHGSTDIKVHGIIAQEHSSSPSGAQPSENVSAPRENVAKAWTAVNVRARLSS